MKSETVDVIVVGGASAGYAAAVAAAGVGAERVVVLEKAPSDQVGGNCRYSDMGFRFVHQGAKDLLQFLPGDLQAAADRLRIRGYSRDDFMSDLQRVTQGRIDLELAGVLVNDSRDAIDWMTGLGHKWRLRAPVEIAGAIHHDPGTALAPDGGGLGLIDRWITIGNRMGIELRSRSRVDALLGTSRRIHGVHVDGPEGSYDLLADAVVLASGGFQASVERRARYLTSNADLMKVRGSRHNTGEVLDMAIQLGAKTAGQWQGAHASPVDMEAPPVEMDNHVNRYAYPYGITVDCNGQRFFDEGERDRTYTYAKTGWAVLRQAGGVAFQIYDQQSVGLFPAAYRSARPVEANSIAELAQKLGLDGAALEKTVEDFNASVSEDVAFDATKEDGRCTRGLAINKSNWARALTEPPFLAYQVTGAITFSFGGVAINRDAQVLNTLDEPMKGLFASGDIVGLFFHNYASCTGMTRNVVFGCRAGAAAGACANR